MGTSLKFVAVLFPLRHSGEEYRTMLRLALAQARGERYVERKRNGA